MSPALRVAAVIARGPARERILADRGAESMYVSGLLQAAALDVVTQPAWRTHLRATCASSCGTPRPARSTACASTPRKPTSTHVPAGGLNLWARLPDGTDLERLAQDCEGAGVIIAAGTEWFPAEAAGPYLRLNYSGPNPAAFPEGARILGEALNRQGR